MIRIELAALIDKLNEPTKYALEQAAVLCISRQNAEVTIEHFLFTLLEVPYSDIRLLLESANLDHHAITQQVAQTLTQDSSLVNYPVFSPLLIELLQEAWLLASIELAQPQLRSGTLLLAMLLRAERYLHFTLITVFAPFNRETLRQNLNSLITTSCESSAPQDSTTPLSSTALTAKSHSPLEQYCNNLSSMARAGKLDPVLGCEAEINLMIDILCRRRKNNPLVVGDAGVGKTAIVEGLAQRIVAGEVPDALKGVELISLDLGLLQAGASVKGEFEKRLRTIIDAVKQAPTRTLLFIDEAHNLIGAGNQEGAGDAANLLKPALARGELSTIAATTWREYKKFFEKDQALNRRFQLIKIKEPSIAQTVTIMRGLHQRYESAHQVLIQDDALTAAAELSARYLAGRQLPDKAIDVLDTACARVAINLSAPPKQLAVLQAKQAQRQLEIALLQRQQLLALDIDKQRLNELQQLEQQELQQQASIQQAWQTQRTIVEQIIQKRQQLLAVTEPTLESNQLGNELTALYQQLATLPMTEQLLHYEVNRQQIAQVIVDWTGVPINQMDQDELQRLTQLPHLLAEQIKGQDHAIQHIHRHLLTARADLRRQGRPKGAFLLVGPSGVGKTETVLQIAEQLYGGKSFLTTINMSEYQEKHTVSRLIGAPPGYVGYGEGGILTEAIRKMPYSVVLLDEVEKAHPEVLNLFYQAFDKGELADGEGRVIDCQNILFFMTSNLGYQTIVQYQDDASQLEEALYPVLADFFKPALLARMVVVPYLPLPDPILTEIIRYKLAQLEKTLMERYQAEVYIADELIAEILQRAVHNENGARMLEAIIDGQLLPPVSLALLNKLAKREAIQRIVLSIEHGKFISQVE